MASPLPTSNDVLQVLRGVIDPELGSDVVELGMVRSAAVDAGGKVVVTIALTTAGCPLRAQIQRDIKTRVGSLEGVSGVELGRCCVFDARQGSVFSAAGEEVV